MKHARQISKSFTINLLDQINYLRPTNEWKIGKLETLSDLYSLEFLNSQYELVSRFKVIFLGYLSA